MKNIIIILLSVFFMACESDSIIKQTANFNAFESGEYQSKNIDSNKLKLISEPNLIKKINVAIHPNESLNESQKLYYLFINDENLENKAFYSFSIFEENEESCTENIYLIIEKEGEFVDSDLLSSSTCSSSTNASKVHFSNENTYVKKSILSFEDNFKRQFKIDSVNINDDGTIVHQATELEALLAIGKETKIYSQPKLNPENLWRIAPGQMVFTKNSPKIVSLDSTNFQQVTMKNGASAWVNPNQFTSNTNLAVVLKETDLLTDSENFSSKAASLEISDLLILANEQDENSSMTKVMSITKNDNSITEYYVDKNSISINKSDVELAIKIQEAKYDNNLDNRADILDDINKTEGLSVSPFFAILENLKTTVEPSKLFAGLLYKAKPIDLPYVTKDIFRNYNLPKASQQELDSLLADVVEKDSKSYLIQGKFKVNDKICVLINESLTAGVTQKLVIFERNGTLIDQLIIFNEFIPGAKFRRDQLSKINEDYSINSEFWYRQYTDEDKKQTFGSSKTVNEISIFKTEEYQIKYDGIIHKLTEEQVDSLSNLPLFSLKNNS